MKNLRKFFILFSLCLFLIMAWESKGVQEQETKEPQVYDITITVDNGEIICDPDPAYARHKDTVVWKSDYAFTVDYSQKTPFKEKLPEGATAFSPEPNASLPTKAKTKSKVAANNKVTV